MIEGTEQLQAGVRKCCNYTCMLESLQCDCTAYLNTPIDVQRAGQAKPWSQSVENSDTISIVGAGKYRPCTKPRLEQL